MASNSRAAVEPYSRVAAEDASLISINCEERAHIYANRVHYSRVYAIVYATALLLSACLLLWVIIESHTQSQKYLRAHVWVFILCDSVVTMMLILEISVAALAQGSQRYFSQTASLVDVGVALLCVLVILLHVLGPSVTAELEQLEGSDLEPAFDEEEVEQEEVETSVLAVRYAAQISRLYVMIRHFKRQQRHCLKGQTDLVEIELEVVEEACKDEVAEAADAATLAHSPEEEEKEEEPDGVPSGADAEGGDAGRQ